MKLILLKHIQVEISSMVLSLGRCAGRRCVYPLPSGTWADTRSAPTAVPPIVVKLVGMKLVLARKAEQSEAFWILM